MIEIYGYTGLIGQEDLVSALKMAVDEERISHAYIIQGEKGSGKGLLAELFAMAIQCDKKIGEPCMECESCTKAIRANHPDIITVHHEKPDTIGVEEIRKQVVEDIAIRPFSYAHKIYIIHDAQKMTPQAQNALLKTLEEPPEYAVIILTAENADMLLPTVRSRCVTLSMRPVCDGDVAAYLMREMKMTDYQAEIYAALARGNIGRAVEMASSEAFAEKMGESLKFLAKSKEITPETRMDLVRKISEDRSSINDYLDIFTLWFRDVLYLKATNEPDGLIFREEYRDINRRASLSSYEGLQIIIESIDKTKTRLAANVNAELALELLFLNIWEN